MLRNNINSDKAFLPINVVGVTASGVFGLPLELQQLILSAKNISAPKRILNNFVEWWEHQAANAPSPELFPSDKPNELIEWLKQRNQKTVLLASGDPLWFGIGRVLLNHFPSEQLIFHPSPTSLQLAFAQLKRPWQDTSWISLHGRDASPLFNLLQQRPNAIGILIDPNKGGANEVREILHSSELEDQYAFWIFEKLGHKEERIFRIFSNEKLSKLDPLHLVVLIKEKKIIKTKKELPLFGIEDGFYLQHADRPGLMTKREVRTQVLADLELPETGVIWDIGAGVGTIGLEALRLRPNLKLLMIEKRIGGKELINENAKRLSVKPEIVIEGEALNFLEKESIPIHISKPNRVILGGGNSRKDTLLKIILSFIQPLGIIVIPLATLEHLEKTILVLKEAGCDVKISQHQNFRGVPLMQGTRLLPMNPVFIIKGKLK
ncbi:MULTISPECIES: bifunctional cobalt-precorrin-7 (C(5))-methyltransferase/cobalt-precorrin-6B (C(15))-methyltransferase [Prochlorococcus]|uniref:Precorrin-6B methylase 2 n=1 Tax=Prochlorococcus marinus (strain SARG / CCMP1375 / SS120) TaxID=167539 RepID=Q7VAW1_PROMA|nr:MULTISPECIES: bifunctional cobalt-precorrin-7 (C(5))-methyltransferase/cobalt-precorrin-6B (C(15))-methyltransferase [Prochlorococcus]AAQ00386.1 Precorrin-6B methylase 2 [Prochlorococcus marinus subsp. marinus str. CCMP1375]KGG14266.1 Cobalt-precorrin-6y C5-methyltransferase [Prochlorococcus marinus str. LG]KGG22161.1 Cobalt-precorrin-6y C5-methyltransferase [Prochlorococcus marinus str. SS2]KGG24521.1 Cobalt-precorrin-6y C5-methyltransferase [Prochlorococcus marinus str. SS35]KGG33416.1 Co